jgi:signal transduction histidine kinase
LERTIDDLVMLARDHDRRTESPDIPALLNETEALWDALPVADGRSLRIVIDPDLRPPRASTAALRQILAVLIENAARHGRGKVTIHAREATSSVAIDVSDEGTESNIDDGVFDRSSADGHGIGLRLARSLAEAEGGRLLLTGRTPTTFTLFLADGDEER